MKTEERQADGFEELTDTSLLSFYTAVKNINATLINEKCRGFSWDFLSEIPHSPLKTSMEASGTAENGSLLMRKRESESSLPSGPVPNVTNVKNSFKSKLKSSLKNTVQLNFA